MIDIPIKSPRKSATRRFLLYVLPVVVASLGFLTAAAVYAPGHSRAIRRLNACGAMVTSNDRDDGKGAFFFSFVMPLESYNVSWKSDFGCLYPPFYAPAEREARPATDEDLVVLHALGVVKVLNISDQDIGDEGIAFLKGLNSLESIDLTGTQVTDASLPVLASLPKLRYLVVAETALSSEGLSGLKKNLPKLFIQKKRPATFKGG